VPLGDRITEAQRELGVGPAADRHHDPLELAGAALPYFVDWLIENVHLVEITAYNDGDAIVWNRGRRAKSVAVLKRAKTIVTSAAFSPDGTRAVTGGDDGATSLWDLKHQGQPVVLTGHTGSITSAGFSPDGTRIVTSSTDGTARIWDAQQGGPALVVLSGHVGTVNRAAFSPDGTVTAGNASQISDGAAAVVSYRELVGAADARRLNAAALGLAADPPIYG